MSEIYAETLRTYLHHSPKVGNRVMIDPSGIIIGQVELSDDVSVWPLTAIRGDVNYIRIGTRSNIQDGCILHVARKTAENPNGFPLIVREDVTIGHGVILHGCVIGNRSLIGMGSRVLDGAVIGDDVMLGAGSLVAPGKHLESGYLYLGNPARRIRPLTPEEIASLLTSARNYVILKDDYLKGQIKRLPSHPHQIRDRQ
ncbi:gamma carbonic anhydrase family protein [Budvicia diplopodorum]|uniref:gamma carbonic anhydrase family protein n=1 Tax=Budvicia diplopodorum TaxID=1119056 RepID=UPI00135831D8|nr:gamma carbonic anhydrase family protein [Budvicia diplopodorum]